MSASDHAALRRLGARRTLRQGSTLFMEGDEPHDVAIVESGDIKIVTSAPNGQELVLDVAGPGDLLGELSALDGSARSASAIALTDCEIASIPVDRFLVFLEEHPASMRALLAVVVRRLRLSNHRQLELSTSDALGRVCARLDEMASRFGVAGEGGVRLELAITQTELAQWCGLSREAVVKALRKLRDLGWVSSTDGAMVIDDRDAVRARGAM
jgi:CRP-like cAMP-binding protein